MIQDEMSHPWGSARRLLVFTTLAWLLVFFTGVSAADQRPSYVEGEVLVKFRDISPVTALPLAAKITAIVPSSQQRVRLLRLAPGASVVDSVAELRGDPNVEYAEPNFIVRKAALPNDPLINNQWALTTIAATLAWDSHTGAGDVIVAVLDTGVDYDHPDLKANLWQNPGELGGVADQDDDGNGIIDDIYGVSYHGSTVTGDPKDDDTADAHGTHVSGIIGAVGDNGVGVAGVIWTTQLMAVKFLHGPDGEGVISDAIKGVDYAIAHGAKIINMSFEVPEKSQFLEEAIKRADAAGVLVVSAAGNGIEPSGGGTAVPVNLDETAVSPAFLKSDNNITVAATTSGDDLSSFSNFGAATVDLGAPGGSNYVGILSTLSSIAGRGDYGYLSGTSMAAPHVSGIAALIWSEYPSLSHHEVKARILNSVDAIPALADKTITGGRVNAYNALVNPPSPAVFKVTPGTVPAGGKVTVIGANFGATTGTIAVGGTNLTVVSWDSNGERVVATVPTTAVSGRVQVNGQGSSFPLLVGPPLSPTKNDSRCFIATAAYGSPLHPKVALLRRFRDEYLLTNHVGRFLVEVYYQLSPPLAAFIRKSPHLKQATVWALTPMVAGVDRLLAMSDHPPEEDQSAVEEKELLVRFKATVPEMQRLAIIQEVNAELVDIQPQAGIYHLRLRGGEDMDAVIRQLMSMDEVDVAEPNWRARKP